jgi:LuxR family maltose regulon positive regulatory protein
MLVRRRLLDRLRQRWVIPITVVSAPAGYGKTTLLAQAIAENDGAPLGIDCWAACGPRVQAAGAFGAALCRSVGADPPAPGGTSEVVTAVVEAMWLRSPQQVALVVDDVHEIPSGSEASRLLAAVVEGLPANGHVVLAGRFPPAIPLARLDVEGRVAHVGERDLAFTDDELAEFAALRGVPVAELSAVSGWPALIELSASAGSHVTGEYLSQEVVARLAPTGRQDLALLAHIGPFDDELARAALGRAVDLEDLLAGFPLVTALGEGLRRLHPLWASLLADEVSADDIASARRRAAAVLLERRDAASAMPLLIEAEAWDDLDRAIVTVLGVSHPPVPHDAPAQWHRRLPAELRARPSGRLLAAVTAAEIDFATAWDRFEECAGAFRRAGDAAGEVACLVQLARLSWWSEEPERLAGLAVRVLQLEVEGREDVAALACLGRALLYDVQNNSKQVLAELDAVPTGSLGEAWQGVVSWLRAVAYLQLGDTEQSLEHADRALVHAGDLHVPLALGTRIQALWYQGRADEAMADIPVVLDGLRRAGYRTHSALALAQCTVAYALRGDRRAAAECLGHARVEAVAPEGPLVETNLSIAAAVLAVIEGDEMAATGVLAACLARHPLGTGLSAGAHLRNLALIYVLVPATRPLWDRAELGPAFLVGRELARAVVALREGRSLPATVRPLPEPAIVGAHLPLTWAAELGVGAVAAGRDEGWRLLDHTWPATRPTVAGLAGAADGSLRRAAGQVLGRLPVPPSAPVELRLLGPIQLRRDGALVDDEQWRRERVRLLLAHLVLNGPASRALLAEDLWPDLDPDGQSRNLRVNLTYLLQVLEPERQPREPSFFIRQHGGTLALHAGDWLETDVWEFDTLCERVAVAERRGSPGAVLDHALRATSLWRGDPAEIAQPWAIAAVEQRRRRFTAVATRAGELLLAQNDVMGAHALAERALEADPWLEAAHRLVVAAHRANRDELAARRALARYREVVEELGIAPGEATRMVARLLDQGATRPVS